MRQPYLSLISTSFIRTGTILIRCRMKEIYLAGGCFWGVEKYLSLIRGVVKTQTGYANGDSDRTDYRSVCSGSGHTEAVRVVYDEKVLSLTNLLEFFYRIIDPLSVNRQGNDRGIQYRTGIYYTDNGDKTAVEGSLSSLGERLGIRPAVEHGPLENWCGAEEHHQNYLDKNPGGYCHINPRLFEEAKRYNLVPEYPRKADEDLMEELSRIQYSVVREDATEPPFTGEYNSMFERGLYVDVTTGEPLFLSSDKFDSGCGWPSFSAPVSPDVIVEKKDQKYGMVRTEVRSRSGDAHLGHVFGDGPVQKGGSRYCINSAALRFIPYDKMEKEGYGWLKDLL